MPRIDDFLERGLSPESAEEKIQEQWYIIEQTLESFGAPGKVVDVNNGPTVTQFGVEPQYHRNAQRSPHQGQSQQNRWP